ncbi:GrpB family protein [Actinoplanes sp. NPDC023714]|uniref:GrpB family protein n=1 Tax=Actinoplanes sp. NPDC023714 TaxID=3154322 RepID=UPI003407A2FA
MSGVEVRAHDPAWRDRARRAIAEVTGALPGLVVAAEHVGSTAVPGLAAKPIIDLMVSADDLDAVVAAEDRLAAIGYRRRDTGMPERLFYQRDGHHLHVVTTASWDTRNERILRDHLLANPADREAYARLKRELAGNDPDTYTRGKTALIQRMVDDARDRLGLPRVDVWE